MRQGGGCCCLLLSFLLGATDTSPTRAQQGRLILNETSHPLRRAPGSSHWNEVHTDETTCPRPQLVGGNAGTMTRNQGQRGEGGALPSDCLTLGSRHLHRPAAGLGQVTKSSAFSLICEMGMTLLSKTPGLPSLAPSTL